MDILLSLRPLPAKTLVISLAAATMPAVADTLRGIELGVDLRGLATVLMCCCGVLTDRGVSAGYAYRVPPREISSGFSLASSRHRLSFDGLAVLMKEATGRDGSGLLVRKVRGVAVSCAMTRGIEDGLGPLLRGSLDDCIGVFFEEDACVGASSFCDGGDTFRGGGDVFSSLDTSM